MTYTGYKRSLTVVINKMVNNVWGEYRRVSNWSY